MKRSCSGLRTMKQPISSGSGSPVGPGDPCGPVGPGDPCGPVGPGDPCGPVGLVARWQASCPTLTLTTTSKMLMSEGRRQVSCPTLMMGSPSEISLTSPEGRSD